MIPTKFKVPKQINIKSAILEFFRKISLADEKILSFVDELQQSRNVMSNQGETCETLEKAERLRNVLTLYISDLYALKSKISFGDKNKGIDIEFTWNDTLTNKQWKSNNIEFEFYNSLFNLAICYFVIGSFRLKKLERTNQNDIVTIKDFRQAYYLFDLIKREAHVKIYNSQLPYDLSPNATLLCRALSIIKAQLTFIDIGERSKKAFEYVAKNYSGICSLYSKCYYLCDAEPLNKYGDEVYKKFLLNRYFFFKAKMYFKLKEKEMEEFEKTTKRYNYALAYQFLGVRHLKECEKTIKEVAYYTNLKNFESLLYKEQKEGEDMYEKNNNVYHQPSVNLKDEKIEEIVRIDTLPPPDLYIGSNEPPKDSDYYNKILALNNIMPPNIKSKIEKFRVEMKKYYLSKISDLENKDTINKFIDSFDLPQQLVSNNEEEYTTYNISIPKEIWRNIEQVQNLGGYIGLLNPIQNIINHSQSTTKILTDTLNEVKEEENEDNMFRIQFGENKWITVPSNKLNQNLVMGLNNYINNLRQTSQYDQKEKENVLNNGANFQLLSESQGYLNQKIPGSKVIKTTLSKEEELTKAKVLELKALSVDIEDMKNTILDYIQCDNKIIHLFMNMDNENSSDEVIFKSEKGIIEQKIEELKKKSDEIKKCKSELSNTILKIPSKQNQGEIPEEAKRFFNNLNNLCNLYMKTYNKFKKAGEYYDKLHQKVFEIIKGAKKFLSDRIEEKEALFKVLTGKSYKEWKKGKKKDNYDNDANDFVNPNNNLFTNTNVFNGLSWSCLHTMK